jgi:hypothetical protein
MNPIWVGRPVVGARRPGYVAGWVRLDFRGAIVIPIRPTLDGVFRRLTGSHLDHSCDCAYCQLRSFSAAPVRTYKGAARTSAVLALAALAAVPVAAEARSYSVDGRVTGAAVAKGRALTVPIQLTPRAGRALRLGTRNVGVRFGRRARLPLAGAGAAGARAVQPRGLRTGDRITGVASLSKKQHWSLRWRLRPTLKLKRVRVIRAGARALGGGSRVFGTPPPPGVPPWLGSGAPTSVEALLSSLSSQSATLTSRVADEGPLAQKIDARRLTLKDLETALEGPKVAFESLATALDALDGQVDPVALQAALDKVEALKLRVEVLKDGLGEIDGSLGELEGMLSTLKGAMDKVGPAATALAAQGSAIQGTAGAQGQLAALEGSVAAINRRLDSADAALDSLGAGAGLLGASLASLSSTLDGLATAAGSAANWATVSTGVDGLEPLVAGLESGFAGLTATGTALAASATEGKAEAEQLQPTLDALCELLPDACP